MSFTIALQPSGKSFTCQAGTDILRAGLAQGVSLRYSCRSGVCRTCRARTIAGEVDAGAVHSNYLSDAEKAAGWVHLCCAKPLSDCVLEVDEIDARLAQSRSMPVRVLDAERLAPDVMRIVLNLPPNEPLRFRPGQYLDVQLPGELRRSYSIATAPTAEGVRQLELHIRHMPGGVFTDRVFETLAPRELLRVDVPRGSFTLDESSRKPAILLVSGTGFAPIKSIVEYCIARGMHRAMHLYWGGRRRADLYLNSLAEQWAAESGLIHYTPVLSEPTAACAWRGRTGLVHRAVMRDFPDLSGFQVYACGAPVMVESARRELVALCGLPSEEFFADSFVSQADIAAAA